MKAGFAVWNQRISPVFDASRNIVLVEIEGRKIESRFQAALPEDCASKIQALQKLEVETLVCGAISRDLASMIADAGIQIIAFVAGDIEEVIAAHLKGGLPDPSLRMPGCQKCRCRNRCGRRGDSSGRRQE